MLYLFMPTFVSLPRYVYIDIYVIPFLFIQKMGCKQSKAKESVTARQSNIAQKNEGEETNDAPYKLKRN
ncbi:hypothetical protein Py17XNL_000801742 [Plasmodium yoelii yoelii]|uniref:Uncharacterized protein n=1 Tax=Plasmodium yoelii yoelii TaxID=73239 RepID=A0AAE9WTA1_PLAYO|nr:hypothetical protein Py17XNL_000801742 [Plasmodium yoelii yoelii]